MINNCIPEIDRGHEALQRRISTGSLQIFYPNEKQKEKKKATGKGRLKREARSALTKDSSFFLNCPQKLWGTTTSDNCDRTAQTLESHHTRRKRNNSVARRSQFRQNQLTLIRPEGFRTEIAMDVKLFMLILAINSVCLFAK